MYPLELDDLKTELGCFDPEDASPIEKVRLAQAALSFVIGLLEDVADETDDENARAYMVDHLKIMASSDHGFLSRDFNLDDWIERLEAREDTEDEK
jgi:hypothetical protein